MGWGSFLPCFFVVERPLKGDFLCDKNFFDSTLATGGKC